MHDQLIADVVNEIAPALKGQTLGKVWQLARAALAFDFHLRAGRYLFIAVEPSEPRQYLIERTVRELERAALAPEPFLLMLRKHSSGAALVDLMKDGGECIVRFHFAARDVLG